MVRFQIVLSPRAKWGLRIAGLGLALLLIAGGWILERRRARERTARAYDRAVGRMSAGDDSQAVEEFTRILESDPEFAPAYRGRGLALTRLRKFDEAQPDLDRAIRMGAEDADVYLARGLARDARKLHRRAIEEYTQALRFDPRPARCYRARAESRLEHGDPRGALSDLDQAAGLEPLSESALLMRAKILMRLRQFEAAEHDLNRILQNQPDHPAALHRRAQSRAARGDDPGAISDLDRLEQIPSQVSPLMEALRWKIQRGEAIDPVVRCSRDLAADPKNREALRTRARHLISDGDPEEALRDLDRIFEAGPPEAQDYVDRAHARRCLGRLEGALSDLLDAAELEPQNQDIAYRLGVLQSDLGYFPAAEAALRNAGGADRVILRLWWVRASQGRLSDASRECRERAERNRSEGTFGWPTQLYEFLAGRIGEESLGVSILTMGLSEDLKAQAFFYLGGRRFLEGDREAAERWWESCLDAGSPGDESLSAAAELRRLERGR